WQQGGRSKCPHRETESAKDPPRPKTPSGRKTPHPGWAGRYSLVSSRNDRLACSITERNNRSASDYTLRRGVRQGRVCLQAKRNAVFGEEDRVAFGLGPGVPATGSRSGESAPVSSPARSGRPGSSAEPDDRPAAQPARAEPQ